MLNVWRLDIRSSWAHVLALCFIGGIGALSTARFSPAFLWWNAGLAAALALAAPAVEWKYGTAAFLHSLPANRDDVVNGRFLGGGLAVLACAVLATGLAFGLAAVAAAVGRPWPAWVCVASLLAFLIVAASLVGVALVGQFALGFGPGSAVASVVALLLVAGVELPAAGPAGAGPGAASRPGGVVAWGVALVAEQAGWPVACLVAGAAATAVLWLARGVARRFHRRREF